MIGMYDEPVAVPIIDLLDSNMMSQYISAAREQYNQAVQEQKEFAKEFGELYGPNANVNKEFYDITRGAVNKGLDYLYQNGIDPVRSAEGRAYIAKIIRERPYAEIANLKAQNESMKTYQKYRAEAMRNGTYDPDFEKFALGGKTLETWDPSKDGMWTREAPSKYSSLKDWTSNLFDNMQLEYDPELTKQAGGMYQVYSKSPKKMQQILDANIKDMIKSDLGRYYLDMYGGDIDSLKADIINRNREYTQIDRRPDQVQIHLNDQRFQANEAAKNRAFQKGLAVLKHKWDQDDATLKAQLSGSGANGRQSPLQWSTRSERTSQRQKDNQVMTNLFDTMQRVSKYWQDRANNTKLSAAQRKQGRDHAAWWNNAIKQAEVNPNSLMKNGLVQIDEYGQHQPSRRLLNADGYASYTNVGTFNDPKKLAQAADKQYSGYMYKPTGGSAEHKVLLNKFAGTEKPQQFELMQNKHLAVNLKDSNLRYSPIRRINVTGNKRLRYATTMRKFDRWLKSGSAGRGALVNEDLNAGWIPGKRKQFDIAGHVTITGKQFSEFCVSIGATSDNDKARIASELGLDAFDAISKPVTKKEEVGSATYYQIPMTRTIQNNGGFKIGEINDDVNKAKFGQSAAFKMANDAQNSSLMID